MAGDGLAAERATSRSLPQGRYWVGLFGFLAGLLGLMLLGSVIAGEPEEDPGAVAAFFVPAALVAASMSRVTMYATPSTLVVRNLCWKRRIAWTRIDSFRVKRYRFSRYYAASVVARTEAGLDIRIWATMTRSRRRASGIATAIEKLAEEHGIPAEIDPTNLRCRWL